MSAGYNSRLKPLAWKGECGDREWTEPKSKWLPKAAELARWISSSRHTVVFTGAGISVASGIPDFRGPKGVWTLEKKGKEVEFDVPFEKAKPTFTHMALVALMKKGLLHYVVSQNVDGLHLKSGIPRDKISELHGNIFAEHCDKCNTEYIRDFDVAGMGCQPTGRFCDKPECGGPLRDKTIDWDSKLPDEEFQPAIEHHKKADLAICLGTSLRIRPAGNMPLRTLRKHKKSAPGKLVIVNLQKTHLDRNASMRLHVRTDSLMREVCRLLNVEVEFDETTPEAQKAMRKEKEEEAAVEEKAAAAAASASAFSSSSASGVVAASSSTSRSSSKKSSKRKRNIAIPAPVARPTRSNTERLRALYNPHIVRRNVGLDDDDEEDDEEDDKDQKEDEAEADTSSPISACVGGMLPSPSASVMPVSVSPIAAAVSASSSAAAASASIHAIAAESIAVMPPPVPFSTSSNFSSIPSTSMSNAGSGIAGSSSSSSSPFSEAKPDLELELALPSSCNSASTLSNMDATISLSSSPSSSTLNRVPPSIPISIPMPISPPPPPPSQPPTPAHTGVKRERESACETHVHLRAHVGGSPNVDAICMKEETDTVEGQVLERAKIPKLDHPPAQPASIDIVMTQQVEVCAHGHHQTPAVTENSSDSVRPFSCLDPEP